MEKNGQTVRVLDEHGTEIGYTYPKRAKGLVKKCRAEFVSDREIRLYKQSPTYENMEDDKMDKNITENTNNFITVNPREWRKNPDAVNTVWSRFFINNPLAEAIPSADNMIEILSLGVWDWQQASRVTGAVQELKPNTRYHFCFWLNGGENDRSDEKCQLQIFFSNDSSIASEKEFRDGLCYCLNRSYIKPLKKYKGWEYYDIPFTTTDARYTQFQFVAERAPMAVMQAEAPEAYKDLQDVLDIYEKKRPQRHNIIFEDGWPVNTWYSTENLARTGSEAMNSGQEDIENLISNLGGIDADRMRNEIMDSVRESMKSVRESMKNHPSE